MGYSSPGTMTDASPRVMRGCQGDATVLRVEIQQHMFCEGYEVVIAPILVNIFMFLFT